MNLVGGSSMPAALNTSSTSTPSHGVSSFDHLVTQWMSRIWWVFGSALNSAQLQLATGFGPDLQRERPVTEADMRRGASRQHGEVCGQRLPRRQPFGDVRRLLP